MKIEDHPEEYGEIRCCICGSENLKEITTSNKRLKAELLHILKCLNCETEFMLHCKEFLAIF